MTIRSINGTSESLNLCPVLPASVTCSICLVLTPLANRLKPYDNEVVTGEMRVQITYERNKVRFASARDRPFSQRFLLIIQTKRALTPRDFEFLKLIGRGTFGKVFQVRK